MVGIGGRNRRGAATVDRRRDLVRAQRCGGVGGGRVARGGGLQRQRMGDAPQQIDARRVWRGARTFAKNSVSVGEPRAHRESV